MRRRCGGLRTPVWAALRTQRKSLFSLLFLLAGVLAAFPAEAQTPGLVLSPSAVQLDEGGSASYTVALATQPTNTVTVSIQIADGEGRTDAQRRRINPTLDKASLTFTEADWDMAQPVAVTVGEDDDLATNWVLHLDHTASGGGYGSVAVQLEVRIRDNDAGEEGTVTITPASTQEVTEGEPAKFMLHLDPAPNSTLVLDVDLAKVGAFTDANGAIGFSRAGESPVLIRFLTEDDNIQEPDGSITASIDPTSFHGYRIGAPSSATIAIRDDDGGVADTRPTVSIAGGAAVQEGDTATFTITATPAPTAPLPVSLFVENGEDIPVAAGDVGTKSVTVGAGGSASYSVDTVSDEEVNRWQGVRVHVLTNSNYRVGLPNFAAVRVTDDQPPRVVAITGVPPKINSTTPFTATFAFSEDVTGFATGDVTVTGATKGAFAGSGQSYTLAVTPSGSADVVVTVAADAATDRGGNTGPAATVSATATWDAAAPTVTITGVPPKINSTTPFTATFAFSEDVTGFATGDVAVTGGTKGAFSGSGRSYTLAVTPTAGSNVVVTVAANSATDGVNAGPASAVSATATWDATAPTVANLTIGDASATEGDALTFAVTLDRAVSGGLTATPTFADGTATSSIDYTENGAALAFAGAAGETRTFTVATTDDDLVEGDETFTVGLTVSGTTETVAATDTGTGTIADDDTASPRTASLSVTPNPVDEGDSTTVTARLSAALPNSVTIPLSLTQGTAEAGDYGAMAGIMIAGGATTGTGTIVTVQDDDRNDETFMVALGVVPDGVVSGSPSSVEVTIRDRTPPPDRTLAVTVSCAPCAIPLGGSVRLTATAFHGDDDPLTWRWSAARGGFSGPVDEPAATWTAPTDLARDVARHEIRVDVSDGRGGFASATVEIRVTGPETVWFLPPMSDPVLQGFVRVLNHSDVAGAATVTATDDAGVGHEPLTLALGPRQAAEFNSDDLESGNPDKGLAGAAGAGTGGWWLVIESDDLELEALAYVRAGDGFVTGMNAVAPREDGVLEIATFNPGSDVDQVSLLRLVNPTDAEAAATVAGVDDAGLSPGEPVLLTLPAESACTVDAAQLESGAGLACGAPQAGLGDGTGKWRLTVASDAALVAMSLLSSPAGRLTNLSGKAARDWDGIWNVDLFPAASDPLGRQGFVRVTNRSNVDGPVTILAYDDSSIRYDTLRLRLGAGESAHFNSDDLELGNRAKGLTGSTGSGRGNWRLRMYSGLRIDANAYVRTGDGFLTAMQARAPAAVSAHRVAFFNPGSNKDQVSVLRLVNRSSVDAEVSIDGTDDLGLRPGSTVQALVSATDAVELTAAELESGEADAIMSGALGDGAGRWRLRVKSNRIAAVLSLLSSPGGHVTNLSYADGERGIGPLPAAILPPPERVTLESPANRELRGRWSAVEGALYDVDLLRDGVADENRSLTLARNTTLTLRWTRLLSGTYAIRARSVNEERVGGPWRVSDEVVID